MVTLSLILLLIAFLYFFKQQDVINESRLVDREYNQELRGILALMIVFSHISHEYTFPFSSEGRPYGMVVVGLFFFFSGYGLIKQYTKRGGSYLDGFLKKRVKKLVPSFLLILLVAGVLSQITDIQVLEMGGGRIGCILIPNSWYVYILFYYYIIFVLSCRFIKDTKMIIYILLGSTIVIIFLTKLIGLGDWWWKSCFSFNLGTIVPMLELKYVKMCKKNERNLTFLLFILLTICLLPNVFEFGYYKIRYLLLIIFTTIFPLFLYLSFRKVRVKKNLTLLFLGSISYEIYLIHGILLTLVIDLLPELNPIYSLVLVYLSTILLAYIIFKVSNICKQYLANV